MAILATHAVRKMRGGSQAQLMLGEDLNLWIVKFLNNPQHLRVLFNEMLMSRIAVKIGLPVPATAIIQVDPWLVDHSDGLRMELGRGRIEKCKPGLQFGSQFLGQSTPDGRLTATVDHLTEDYVGQISNLHHFAGILALDKWMGNCDSRQAVFTYTPLRNAFRATFIDHGFCLNVGEWNFPYITLRGIYGLHGVYKGVTGWPSFSPWLERIENFQHEALMEIAEAIPTEWHNAKRTELTKLIDTLFARRTQVRSLINDVKNCDIKPFPNWVA